MGQSGLSATVAAETPQQVVCVQRVASSLPGVRADAAPSPTPRPSPPIPPRSRFLHHLLLFRCLRASRANSLMRS
jgi:hypothetical protein